MADLRCSYCGRRPGEDHSRRCGVTRQNFPEAYVEYPSEILAERDRYREALEQIAATEFVGGSNLRGLARVALEKPSVSGEN